MWRRQRLSASLGSVLAPVDGGEPSGDEAVDSALGGRGRSSSAWLASRPPQLERSVASTPQMSARRAETERSECGHLMEERT